MYKSKLIDLLKVLHRTEKEALRKWANSPVHHQHNKSRVLLFLLLEKRCLTQRSCDRYQIFKVLFPNKNYHDAELKHLMNYCVKMLEDFIEFLMYKEQPFLNKKGLISFYTERGLVKYAQQHTHKIKTQHKKQALQNSTYYHERHQLEEIIFEEQSKTRSGQTNLQAIFDQQYIVFILDTLKYACEAITHQRLYKSDYKIPLLDEILTQIKAGDFDTIPAIQIYFYSYQSLRHPEDESHFQTLRNLMIKHPQLLSRKEIKSVFQTAINYCVQKLNSGQEKYVQEVFDLYQYGLTYKVLIEHNKLSRFAYKNIATAAIRLEKYDWVKTFISTYKTYLAVDYQENYAHYVNAKLLYAQQQYDACMESLIQVEYDDLFLNMSAKSLLLKIYYEQQYVDALEALLVSFRRFLQRKSIVAYQRNIYENLISLTEKLISLPLQDKKKKAQLKEEIENCHPLTEKPWLLAQLDKLSRLKSR